MEAWDFVEVTIWSYASLSYQNMNVRVEIDAISEGLDDADGKPLPWQSKWFKKRARRYQDVEK